MKLTFITLILLATSGVANAQKSDSCAEFNGLVKKTYNFDVEGLTPPQMEAKSKLLDKFWHSIEAHRKQYLPCLRASVADPKTSSFFRYDGSNLLVSIDPTLVSKALQTRVYTTLRLDSHIVSRQTWLSVLAQRGGEGFDVSEAATRWLNDPNSAYMYRSALGEYYNVNMFTGALFLFGSMDESRATPTLIKIVNEVKHPQRMAALSILMDQGTPDALKAIGSIDLSQLTPEYKPLVEKYLLNTPRFEIREKPLTSREEFLQVLKKLEQGNSNDFRALAEKVPDGERDMVTVMTMEDLPLLRKIRRILASKADPNAIGYYDSFTDVILTIVWRNETRHSSPATSRIS